jgi:hypothetical protein
MRNGLIAIGVACLVTGCGLMPKAVEFGQRKVRAVPEKTEKAVEAERQAAQFIARATSEARDEALRSHYTNVIPPLTEARDAAGGLSYSLGAPLRPWTDSGAELARRLGYLEARLDRDLDRYREKVAPDVGKKIEGTGIVQIPYFLWLAIVAGALFLIWTGVKVVGAVYPPVGLGVAGVSAAGRIGARTASRALAQIVRGGEAFKEALRRSDIDDKAKSAVFDLLRRHQMVSQDEPVQRLVQEMTRHPKI